MHEEVVVIGLGAAGSYAAWQLAREGVRVVGLEREDLLHTRGAYSGESRLFRTAYHEGASYVPLLLDSRRAWLELQSLTRRQIFLQTGVLSIGAPEAKQLVQVRESVTANDLPHEMLSRKELAARFPQHDDLADDVGILDLFGGVLRPESAVAEIQAQAKRAGAQLHGNTPVVSLEEHEDHVRVEMAGGEELTARRVIVTAGEHTARLVPDLAAHLTIRPIVLTWFCPEDPGRFSPDVFPAFIRDQGELHLFGAPTLDGSLVKAGSDARFGTISDGADLPARLTDEQRQRVAQEVHRLLPGLPPYVLRESFHFDLYTPDRAPMLGPVSERIVVGTGFSGHGFKLSPAYGQALADFARGKQPNHDLSSFAPNRFAPSRFAPGRFAATSDTNQEPRP